MESYDLWFRSHACRISNEVRENNHDLINTVGYSDYTMNFVCSRYSEYIM